MLFSGRIYSYQQWILLTLTHTHDMGEVPRPWLTRLTNFWPRQDNVQFLPGTAAFGIFPPAKFKDPKVYLVNGCQKAVDNVLYIVHPAPCIVKVSLCPSWIHSSPKRAKPRRRVKRVKRRSRRNTGRKGRGARSTTAVMLTRMVSGTLRIYYMHVWSVWQPNNSQTTAKQQPNNSQTTAKQTAKQQPS